MQFPNFSARMMNSTKRREVLCATMRTGVEFEIAYVWERKFQRGFHALEEILGEDGVADPGLSGGPVEYKEIFALRVSRVKSVRNPTTGAISQSDALSKTYLAELEKLGQLPITLTPEHIRIDGYVT